MATVSPGVIVGVLAMLTRHVAARNAWDAPGRHAAPRAQSTDTRGRVVRALMQRKPTKLAAVALDNRPMTEGVQLTATSLLLQIPCSV
jgi:hypothetical protein